MAEIQAALSAKFMQVASANKSGHKDVVSVSQELASFFNVLKAQLTKPDAPDDGLALELKAESVKKPLQVQSGTDSTLPVTPDVAPSVPPLPGDSTLAAVAISASVVSSAPSTKDSVVLAQDSESGAALTKLNGEAGAKSAGAARSEGLLKPDVAANAADDGQVLPLAVPSLRTDASLVPVNVVAEEKLESVVSPALSPLAGVRVDAGAAASTAAVQHPFDQALRQAEAKVNAAIEAPVRSASFATELADKVVWLSGRQGQFADFSLNPPQMGALEVRLTLSGGDASAQFFSANPMVRDAIDAALPKLRELMAQAGISLGEAESKLSMAPGAVPSGAQLISNSTRAATLNSPDVLLNESSTKEVAVRSQNAKSDSVSTKPNGEAVVKSFNALNPEGLLKASEVAIAPGEGNVLSLAKRVEQAEALLIPVHVNADATVDAMVSPSLPALSGIRVDAGAATLMTPVDPFAKALRQTETKKINAAIEASVGSASFATELAEKVVWLAGRQSQLAELTLNPPQMGVLEVRLTVTGGDVNAQFFSPTPEVRDGIIAALPKLRELMAQAGLNLDETEPNLLMASGGGQLVTSSVDDSSRVAAVISSDLLLKGSPTKEAVAWVQRAQSDSILTTQISEVRTKPNQVSRPEGLLKSNVAANAVDEGQVLPLAVPSLRTDASLVPADVMAEVKLESVVSPALSPLAGVRVDAGAAASTTAVQHPFEQALRQAEAKVNAAIEAPVRSASFATELADKVVWLSGRQGQFADFSLNPPQMGALEIRLTMSGGDASAQFFSANPMVRDAIDAALPKLRELMAQAGISLGEAEVRDHAFSRRESAEMQDQFTEQDADIAANQSALAGIGVIRSNSLGLVDLYI